MCHAVFSRNSLIVFFSMLSLFACCFGFLTWMSQFACPLVPCSPKYFLFSMISVSCCFRCLLAVCSSFLFACGFWGAPWGKNRRFFGPSAFGHFRLRLGVFFGAFLVFLNSSSSPSFFLLPSSFFLLPSSSSSSSSSSSCSLHHNIFAGKKRRGMLN